MKKFYRIVKAVCYGRPFSFREGGLTYGNHENHAASCRQGPHRSRAISDIIDYVANPKKTDSGRLITGYACDSRTADAEFLLAKRQYLATTGRVRGADDVIAYHVRQSFRPGEITSEEANRLGVEFAKRFTKGNHAFVVCTHIDKSHIHNHIIWSSVSLEYDRKFRNFGAAPRQSDS